MGGTAPSLDDLTPVSLMDMYTKMGERKIAAHFGVSKPAIQRLRRLWGIPAVSKTERAGFLASTRQKEVGLEVPFEEQDKPTVNEQAQPNKVPCTTCGMALAGPNRDIRLCGTCRLAADAKRAREKRAAFRVLVPVKATRTFICQECGDSWETEALGHFNKCSKCKEKDEVLSRTKVCQYRHCGRSFVDMSPKNGLKFCHEEHRRREKLLRTGKAPDLSYFTKEDPVG